jgi:hypothetical protein
MKLLNLKISIYLIVLLSSSGIICNACTQIPNTISSNSTSATAAGSKSGLTYPIVDSGQIKCYDNFREISCPTPGSPFYGQDSQFTGNLPGYTLNADGLTVYDTITGLTWQRSPDINSDGTLDITDKLTWSLAQNRPAALNKSKFGGFNDWRLPTIKELYSLIQFAGTDPNLNNNNTAGLIPFIDTNHFKFAYGQESAGERIIDSQYASCTLYVSKGWNGDKLFGVNFADGRIKGYGLTMIGPAGMAAPNPSMPLFQGGRPGGLSAAGGGTPNGEKTFFVLCVRGNTEYGKNNFTDNGNGTITDRATDLIWAQMDSGSGMNWQDALAWVQKRNSEKYLGYSDWRLPEAKELESIVDYTRSPDTTGSAAIDPLFKCTGITNEAGKADFPFYWTGTTHVSSGGAGSAGVYVSFGRAMGNMNNQWQDVHGAGAQRSDPKSGNPANFASGRGPQGDAVRINNYVRCVRDAK